ncbi:MAG: hypothetical protein QOJ21_2119, partial [Solirubrobacteraceae bacterium]|nr:hypothetical protein [Solirubrobacteraceae bacterium]
MARNDLMATDAPPAVAFEVDRFEWTAPDRIELSGRWFGIRGHRFMRPSLVVDTGEERRRLLAVLEHKPWAATDGEPWLAAFAWAGEPVDLIATELSVAPSVAVELPPPQAPGRRSRSTGGRPRASRPGRAASSRIVAQPEGRGDALRAELRDAKGQLDALRAEQAGADRAGRADTGRVRAELAKARAELEELRGERADTGHVRAELAEARAELEQLRAERDDAGRLRGVLAEARVEVERLRAQTDDAAADAARGAEAALRERDAARAERDGAVRERDAGRRERNDWMSRVDTAIAARDAA